MCVPRGRSYPGQGQWQGTQMMRRRRRKRRRRRRRKPERRQTSDSMTRNEHLEAWIKCPSLLTTYFTAFSWMKTTGLGSKFHWSLILGFQLTGHQHFDGLVQERRNSSALAMEFRLSCTNPSICSSYDLVQLSKPMLTKTKTLYGAS